MKPQTTFSVRRIRAKDLENGVFECLSNLTTVGDIKNDLAKARRILRQIMEDAGYNIFVCVKDGSTEIIGMATLFVEQKLIHDGGKVGHVEDVVTKKGFEGMGVASTVVNEALKLAKRIGCYKVILDCSEKNAPFYEKLNFKRQAISMRYDMQ